MQHRKPDPHVKPKPHPHPHPIHSGDFVDDPSFDSLGQQYRQEDRGRPPQKAVQAVRYGTVAHAVQQIITAVRALSTPQERNSAVGYALARMIEQQVIAGMSAPHAISIQEINRYNWIE